MALFSERRQSESERGVGVCIPKCGTARGAAVGVLCRCGCSAAGGKALTWGGRSGAETLVVCAAGSWTRQVVDVGGLLGGHGGLVASLAPARQRRRRWCRSARSALLSPTSRRALTCLPPYSTILGMILGVLGCLGLSQYSTGRPRTSGVPGQRSCRIRGPRITCVLG